MHSPFPTSCNVTLSRSWWLQFGFLRSKQTQTANSKQALSLVSSRIVITNPFGWWVPNSRVPAPTQPRGKGGEPYGPEQRLGLGTAGTRGVDAVELEPTGGSRPRHSAEVTTTRSHLCLVPALAAPRRLGHLPGGFESAGD